MDLVDAGAWSELAPIIEQTFQAVVEAMFPVYAIHNFDFHRLLEEQNLSDQECLAEMIDLALMDPLYNFHRIENNETAIYDRISTSDTGVVLKGFKRVFKRVGHGKIFCPAL